MLYHIYYYLASIITSIVVIINICWMASWKPHSKNCVHGEGGRHLSALWTRNITNTYNDVLQIIFATQKVSPLTKLIILGMDCVPCPMAIPVGRGSFVKHQGLKNIAGAFEMNTVFLKNAPVICITVLSTYTLWLSVTIPFLGMYSRKQLDEYKKPNS